MMDLSDLGLRDQNIRLRAENVMLLNVVQRAQRLIAEGHAAEADETLRQAINKVLREPL